MQFKRTLKVGDDVVAIMHGDSEEARRAQAAQFSIAWITFSKKCIKDVCVVFDIDDTLVNGEERVIPSIAEVYHRCAEMGVPIYLVTARPESEENRRETKKMLAKNGFTAHRRLYMIPRDVKISSFKTRARQDIAREHSMCACFGDQFTDHLLQLLPRDKQLESTLRASFGDGDCAVFVRGRAIYVKLPENAD